MNDLVLDREDFNIKYSYHSATPMIQQYLDLKFEHQDCLLLFRMGDFYKLFFDDAVSASKILGIALSKRGKVAEEEIQMCGVPHHALENYLHKLLEQNHKVALCEQLESPIDAKKRAGSKAVVKREITRIITPGTILESNVLNAKRANYLAAIFCKNSSCALGFLDILHPNFILLR